jgi:hypothetical protein
MLYESLGELLRAAADTLHRDVRPHVGDDRVRTQLDAMVALANDVGAMWPGLFAGLERQNRIFESALGWSSRRSDDPLAHRGELIAALNARIDALHEDRSPAGVVELATLREALAAAAVAERKVVDLASAAAEASSVRRM